MIMLRKRCYGALVLAVCFLLAGCSVGKEETDTKESSEDMQTESVTIRRFIKEMIR